MYALQPAEIFRNIIQIRGEQQFFLTKGDEIAEMLHLFKLLVQMPRPEEDTLEEFNLE